MTSFQNSITPIKVGIKFDPPSILLVYRDKGKLRSRQIPAKNVDILTDVTLYVEKFKENAKYKKYFEKIPHKKLEKIVFILQDNMKGYTLKESLLRSKKFDDKAINDDTDVTESNLDKSDTKKKDEDKNEDDYDDDDFHDTEDEDDKNEPPSVSTIEDVKAKKEIKVNLMDAIKPLAKQGSLGATAAAAGMSKTSALDLLSTQIKSVKNSIYDFEDDIEEEINKDSDSDEDDDDDDSEKKPKKKKDEKMEVAQDDDSSDSSF